MSIAARIGMQHVKHMLTNFVVVHFLLQIPNQDEYLESDNKF